VPDSLESLDLSAYRSLPDSALSRLAGDVRSRLPGGWEAGSDRFGVWARQAVVGLRFRLLPGGVHRIGLSDDELAAAVAIAPQPQMTVSEMMPVRDVKLQALLVGDLPITQAVARQFVADLDTGYPDQPAMLSRDEALAIAGDLRCRLPSEAEWEACCRAGSSTLFPWGSTLPEAPVLDRWMAWSLTDESIERNALGFGGLFFGEWCSDEFRVSHDPDAAIEPGAYVVQGGAAQFWPWQDQEWVWCACAMRMPSTGLFADQRCAARVVRELE
jgi:formylglycine-generating enzyme